ncbi:hypothetical protein BVRB_1g016330 [Beta vulgaris subsp. vulgaris]|uniref:uncharacterized protein LOC104905119 n=1 Tax=Beta vulgaris subsp. vulgaris TaxID=3555 RepID=UPI00053F50E1|nr:uncharacterized protein LOC104905119 [Beta vulgaris subsp. vulgaris]KMT00278.1 hypothetical protein BVRB_1g016330 [Beta vulgaris subsp. vulgaris]
MKRLSKNQQDHTNDTMNNNGGLAAAKNELNDGLFTEDEFDVGNTLLDLPYLITNYLSSYRFPYHWNTKKRRSALVSPPSFDRKLTTPVKTEAATSPNTPLSFSPSPNECDYKFKHSAKRKTQSLNLRKEELETTLRDRILTQEQLKKSIGKVKGYLNVLNAENSKLMTLKQELLCEVRVKNELGCTVMTRCTTQMQQQQKEQKLTISVNDRVHAVPSTSSELHHQPPLISLHQIHDVSDNAYVGPTTTTTTTQLQHHHQQLRLVNDPMCVSSSNTTQFPYLSPLIIHQQHQQHQQYALIINQADQIHHQNQQHHQQQQQQREEVMFDLNIQPDETNGSKAMAKAARMKRYHKIMSTRRRGHVAKVEKNDP